MKCVLLVHGVMHGEEEGVEHKQTGKALRARDEQRRNICRRRRRGGARSRVPNARAYWQNAHRVFPCDPPEAPEPAAQADRLSVHPVPTDPRHARSEHIEREEDRGEQDVRPKGHARAPQRRRAHFGTRAYPVPYRLQQRGVTRALINHAVGHVFPKRSNDPRDVR